MQIGDLKGLTAKARSILDKSKKYRAEAESVKSDDPKEAERLNKFADELENEAEELANIALKLSEK